MSKAKILVVDDEPKICQILETRLKMVGYEVATAADGLAGLKTFGEINPDLVMDGYGVCEKLRNRTSIPILMLSAIDEVSQKIACLQLGADDYMVKPFSPKELIARIGCLLRRRAGKAQAKGQGIPSNTLLVAGDLRIDSNRRKVYRGDEQIRLTELELSLLEVLVENAGKAIDRIEILRHIWGYTPERLSETRVVDVHVSRLRCKIEIDPENPELILTCRGTGYMFQRLNG
ncbi:MAG: winged helix-turn-helix domain-containing protein [Cyanobacteria bacterium]|nr:winged helix-turn-helix domain-containing protein [Cyanobacteriota bacterium]